MKPRLFVEWLLRRLSWPGVLGLALAAAALWTLAVELPRMQSATAQAQGDLAALHLKLAAQAKAPPLRLSSDAERLAKFYAALTPAAEVPNALARLFVIAQTARINLRQGDFQRSESRPGKYTMLQFSLPVKAAYPQLMDFIDEALAANPSLTLEEVVFKRETAANATLEATLKFALYSTE